LQALTLIIASRRHGRGIGGTSEELAISVSVGAYFALSRPDERRTTSSFGEVARLGLGLPALLNANGCCLWRRPMNQGFRPTRCQWLADISPFLPMLAE
jgi:hypothetical protein